MDEHKKLIIEGVLKDMDDLFVKYGKKAGEKAKEYGGAISRTAKKHVTLKRAGIAAGVGAVGAGVLAASAAKRKRKDETKY